ncbi:uncharacterized protein LOC110866037 [Helianthus annuus]|uniref:uncharacterized protein LOC110866037 n=1 Tax=Helianthus annuus TaxID=4232 RepID=UPI000B8F9ACB|nr:uncharacterized protein LOC110866037 [Helianthus annuus]
MAAVDSIGRSGGLASLWNPSVFSCSEVVRQRYFLCICGNLIPSGIRLNIVNVYAPNDASARRGLWSDLTQLRNSRQSLWVFAGDFNDVRHLEERRNLEYVAANADAFNDFILSAALQEFDMGGEKFTYILDRGDKLSFVEFVLNKCNQFSFNGPGDLALATKLRWLKNRIKEWIVVEKQSLDGLYSMRKAKVDELESMAEVRDLCQDELDLRMEYKQFLREFDEHRQSDMRQKARVRGAIDGDENSGFFHATVNANLSSNRVNGIFINDDWITNPTSIKQHFFEYYSQLFTEPMQNCQTTVLLAGNSLTPEME